MSFDLVSHVTSICCRRIEMVPETFCTHGIIQLRPGLAIFSYFPHDSTIFTVPVLVTTQQTIVSRRRSLSPLFSSLQPQCSQFSIASPGSPPTTAECARYLRVSYCQYQVTVNPAPTPLSCAVLAPFPSPPPLSAQLCLRQS